MLTFFGTDGIIKWKEFYVAGVSMENKKVMIIGIAGGTGSGKTTLAEHIRDALIPFLKSLPS